MYRMSLQQEQLQKVIYEKTPIDTIMYVQDLYNGVEVTGRAGKDILTYRIYNNGAVTEK